MDSQTPSNPTAESALEGNLATPAPGGEPLEEGIEIPENKPTGDPEELVLPEADWQPLHPLPRGLVQLYGLLAVLFVLVPEWVAGGALFGFRDTREGSMLPPPSGAWKRLPELRLASLSLAQMRLLADQLGLKGYAREGRETLTTRLLKRLRRQR